jgi:sugar lactone lactonase YvrE
VSFGTFPGYVKTSQQQLIHPSCTADIEGNDKEFIFGGKYGYGIANKETGDYRWVKKVWSEDEIKAKKHEKFRGNDGAVDSQGRFWAGFMFDPLVEEMRSDGTSDRFSCVCFEPEC